MAALQLHDLESGWSVVHRIRNGRVVSKVGRQSSPDGAVRDPEQQPDRHGRQGDARPAGGRGGGGGAGDPRGGNPWPDPPEIDDGLAPSLVAPRRPEQEFADWEAFARHVALLRAPTAASFAVHGRLPDYPEQERALRALPSGSQVQVLMRQSRD